MQRRNTKTTPNNKSCLRKPLSVAHTRCTLITLRLTRTTVRSRVCIRKVVKLPHRWVVEHISHLGKTPKRVNMSQSVERTLVSNKCAQSDSNISLKNNDVNLDNQGVTPTLRMDCQEMDNCGVANRKELCYTSISLILCEAK